VRILGVRASEIQSIQTTEIQTHPYSFSHGFRIRSFISAVHWLLDRQQPRSRALVDLLAHKGGQSYEAAVRGQQHDNLPDFWLYSAPLSLLDMSAHKQQSITHPAAALFCISKDSPYAKDAYVSHSKVDT